MSGSPIIRRWLCLPLPPASRLLILAAKIVLLASHHKINAHLPVPVSRQQRIKQNDKRQIKKMFVDTLSVVFMIR